MTVLLGALVLLILSGLAALCAGRARWASALGAGGAAVACTAGLWVAGSALIIGAPVAVRFPWSMPLGTLAFGLDRLSAFFLLPILGLSGLTAIYGFESMRPHHSPPPPRAHWLCFNLLIASMVVVCLARSVLLFLLAWEGMALASFFLVATENAKAEVRKAAWIYLIATHLGTAFLFPMFLIMARAAGAMEFDAMAGVLGPGAAGVCFILGLIGFGTKAGIMPFHVWLPEAHPAAPSHISALMSGVMIKTGIYGLVRLIALLGAPPLWWGVLLAVVGAASGVLGVLFALAQHDLKRLLAYHSVENIGIILLGLGVGLIGLSTGAPVVAALGFAGALLHVINHAVFKGLLFLGAGAVLHATHTREMDELGGLLRRMPATGIAFLVGAAAISGLPPLNGFVSEFLVYLGSFRGLVALPPFAAVSLAGVITALALIGGLAAACFTKAFGIVFLGEPRSPHAAQSHEVRPLMILPMLLLAAACVALGLAGPVAARAALAVAAAFSGALPVETMRPITAGLQGVALGALLLLALIGALAVLRRALARRVPAGVAGTWDCGYAAPSTRMQYTASSFAQPITEVFHPFLRTRTRLKALDSYFPAGGHLTTETPDVGSDRVYRPLFGLVERLLSRVRVLQSGRIQLYILYIVLTLLALLLWNIR